MVHLARPHVDIITQVKSAIHHGKVPPGNAAEIRSQVASCLYNAKPPESNLTKEQRTALTDLGKDRSIQILPADKVRCTVILNKSDYDDKIASLLNDNDPTTGYKNKIVTALKSLKEKEIIDQALYYRLYPT